MTALWVSSDGLESLAGRSVADLLGEEYARRRNGELAADGERLAVWARPANLSRLQLLLEHVASGAAVTDPTLQRYARDVAADAGRVRQRWEALAARETRASWERETVATPGREKVDMATLWASYLAAALALAAVIGVTVSRLLWLAGPP